MVSVWEGKYMEAYDKVMLNSEIYTSVRDFHVNTLKKCKIVLDSGCGTGNVALELLKKGCMVYAVDKSKKALSILKIKCARYQDKLRIKKDDAESLTFDNNKFDGINSMFVIHFVDDVEKYLTESYRVLKKNGIIVITGRISMKKRSLLVKSYENSLKRKGLIPKFRREMNIVRDGIMNDVKKAAKMSLQPK